MPIGPKQMNILHFVRSKSQRKKLSYKRGVGQKMTKADEGGRGGHPNADNCWRGGEGGSAKRWPLLTEGGGGVYELLFLADVICEQPLTSDISKKSFTTSKKGIFFARSGGVRGGFGKRSHFFRIFFPATFPNYHILGTLQCIGASIAAFISHSYFHFHMFWFWLKKWKVTFV